MMDGRRPLTPSIDDDMDIKFSVSSAGLFSRIQLSFHEECELSAIITSPSGREEIYLPSPDRFAGNVSYSQSGGRFVTCTGRGRYQIIFQPKEKGEHAIKVLGRASRKPFEKIFHITF
jgi:hypothetical protein